MAANDRKPFYLTISNNKLIEMNLKTASYGNDLQTVLGLKTSAGDTENIIGKGAEDALENGAVPINLVYKKAANKVQTAKVLCSPSKADTVFQDAIGKKYNGKEIIKVRFPRRRCYTW